MSLTISSTEFDLFRDLIEKECGIAIGNEKAYLLETRLSKLLAENCCDNFSQFYAKTKSDLALKNKIIDAMTTNETLWFRDNSPYITLKEHLFPQFAEQVRKGEKKQVRIWSAACSSGQEPYSMSIIAHEAARLGKGNELIQGGLSITATDLSSSVLFIAKTGRYDPISISRGMPDDLRDRYFKQEGRVYVLDQSIKQMVQFQQMNLLKPFDGMGKFDIVMLRNVAIYFSAEFKTALFKKIAKILNPDGYLFLGASESLYGYSDDFTRLEYGSGSYYQVKRSAL